MDFISNPGTTDRNLMAYLKTLLIISIYFIIMIAVSGCMNSDEKNYTGTAQGEFPLHFDLTMKYSGEDNLMYELKVIPTNNEVFLNNLNRKREEEMRLKFSAYDKMKQYFNQQKDSAMFLNLNEIKKEAESKDVPIFFTIKIYGHKKKELDNISGKLSCDLSNKEALKESWMKVASSVPMNRAQFRKIESVELHTK